jgi:hypothetical protein
MNNNESHLEAFLLRSLSPAISSFSTTFFDPSYSFLVDTTLGSGQDGPCPASMLQGTCFAFFALPMD